MRCSMSGCLNDSQINKNVLYFKFPLRLEKQNLWKSICKIDTNVGVEDAQICSLHFKTCDLVQKSGQICLVKTALPLPYQSNVVVAAATNSYKIPALNSINIVQNIESSIYNNKVSWNEKHKENYTSLISKTDSVVIAGNPEFKIHKKRTEIFAPDKFQCRFIIELPEPNDMASTKSVANTKSSQTNTNLCGSVEISDCSDEFRLNCFYCGESFPLEKWSLFVEHLKEQHLKEDPLFLVPNFPYSDHDYTTTTTETTKSVIKTCKNKWPTPVAPTNVKGIKRTIKEVKTPKSTSLSSNSFKTITLSDTESEDETVITKATTIRNKVKVKSKPTRPAAPSKVFAKPHKPPAPVTQVIITNKDEYIAKKVVQQTLLNIRKFEAIYKTVKTKPPKDIYMGKQPSVISSGGCYIKNIDKSTVTEKQSKKTPLNRCLKRANTEISEAPPETQETEQTSNQSELVFQFTPRDIILDLLDSIKDYPVLWEFTRDAHNKEYADVINKLSLKINEKWSLNLSALQMRCSINRVLAFYRFMLPCKKIQMFKEYFDKCAEFLPSSVRDIPRKRCVYCDVVFVQDSHMQKHLTDAHEYLKWPYKCDYCSERFKESDEYELHKNLPHYIEVFKCPKCKATFNRHQSLKIHLKNHHEPKKNLEKTVDETQPTVVKHEPKRYKCHLCDKVYNQSNTLLVHLKKHRHQYDYVCEVCGKAFLRRAHLNQHMDIHTGVKVTCNICNLQLKKACMSRHLRLVHVACEGTLESTFRARCYRYKKFTEEYARKPKRPFKRNKESKPRSYDCKICNVHFDRLKLLKDHNNLIHDNKQIMYCRICNKAFKYHSNMRQHYTNIHKLHSVQIAKLDDHNEDLEKVLNLKIDDMEETPPIVQQQQQQTLEISPANEQQQFNDVTSHHSPSIQDEIMKAIENIEKEEIKTDDGSMNDFFKDLMKH